MKLLKITIIGNSVALRKRPPGVYPYNKNYGELIEDILSQEITNQIVKVNNLAFGRATIFSIWEQENTIINDFPDYYILNIGIVDAVPREIPLWYSTIIDSKRSGLIKYILTALHSGFIKKNRALFTRIRRKKTWTNQRKFSKIYEKLITTLLKETNSQILTMSINTPNERIEEQLPGSKANVQIYNNIIKNLSDRYSIRHIDLNNTINEEYYPDGIHYSVDGHKLVAKEISNLIFQDIIESKKNAG